MPIVYRINRKSMNKESSEIIESEVCHICLR